MTEFDFSAYQHQVQEQVAGACGDIRTLEAVMQHFYVEAEQLLAADSADSSLIDCAAGCSSCCVVNVSTLFPEGLLIAQQLRRQGGAALEEIQRRLVGHWRQVHGLDDEERMIARVPCAFLDSRGCCSIYPVRPLLCRSMTSTSRENCRAALTGCVLGEEPAVLVYQFQLELYQALFSGVAQGVEAKGREGRSYQLTGLLNYLLSHPAAQWDWFSGTKFGWELLL